ncbi:hypothetical protein ACQP2P_31285 [Dactylosporangium sp. CA-139114]|uniref:hypothetical protein n=1 Tax=Dactylosporangium sp. CA-139114 TaxID=3239931 RepID=UPI003D989018
MAHFIRWYGANPLHLLALLCAFALAGYAAVRLFSVQPVGVAVWLVGAAIAHDLILFPLYALADRSAQLVTRHRAADLPTVPWVTYVRVPTFLSGLLLLVWFPLILGIVPAFQVTTGLPPGGYLGRWLAITGLLYGASALAFALSLRRARRATGSASGAAPTATTDRGQAGRNDE